VISVGLAGQNAAADRRIAFGDTPGAVDEIADGDDNIGIGAQHRQVAPSRRDCSS
jgi:hypothetical protein